MNRAQLKWFIATLMLLSMAGCATKTGHKQTTTSEATEAVPVVMYPPRYPREAAEKGLEGIVCFAFTIFPDGSVSDARITKSRPGKVFDAVATDALVKWKFKPKFVNGQAVSDENATFCLNFKLSK